MSSYSKRLTPRTALMILFTLGLGMILSVMPLSPWLTLFRPPWVPLVVALWVYFYPKQLGVGFACFVGLLMDVLNGTTLGQHGFAFVVLSFLLLKFHRQLKSYSLLQQSVSVGLMIFVYKLTLYLLQGFIDHLPPHNMVWVGVFTSFILWPFLVKGLRRHGAW